MRRRTQILLSVVGSIVVAGFIISQIVTAQTETAVTTQVYNPYPPGILPAGLNAEIARVLREIDVVEERAIERWHRLPPPIVTGQPPILKNTGTERVETLGQLMNFDRRMSPGRNQACSSCHMPYAAFSGPIPSVNLTMIAYPGTAHFRAGKRTAQRYTYSPFFPVLQFNQEQGLFFGGNFWDSRATGYLLRNPDAQQAQGPPVDTQEMGFPDTACVAFRLSRAVYRPLFEEVWGQGSLDINFPPDTEQICAIPGGAAVFGGNVEPVNLSPGDRNRANVVYDRWAQSIDSYEQSVQVSAYSSKFDAFIAGNYTMTPTEQAGYNLFKGKANCNSCHLDGRSTAPTPAFGTAPNGVDTGAVADLTPVFTCFGSSNLGIPKNPRNSFYYENTPDAFGFTLNPAGFSYTDFGLGAFLRSGYATAPNPNVSWRQFASTTDGKMQVSTARDVALTPPQCPTTEAPGPYFQKEFFHNGYIKSLKQLVHFYNTRDDFKFPVESGNCPAGTVEKVTCWPAPEVTQNMTGTIGHLGLTDTEENQIVAFLQTLNDGFTTPYPDINTFTGSCMSGGTAATQGNSTIIPANLLRRMAAQQQPR